MCFENLIFKYAQLMFKDVNKQRPKGNLPKAKQAHRLKQLVAVSFHSFNK